jgi:hypothetical protein
VVPGMTETSPSEVSFPCHIIAQSTDWGFFFKPSMSTTIMLAQIKRIYELGEGYPPS